MFVDFKFKFIYFLITRISLFPYIYIFRDDLQIV